MKGCLWKPFYTRQSQHRSEHTNFFSFFKWKILTWQTNIQSIFALPKHKCYLFMHIFYFKVLKFHLASLYNGVGCVKRVTFRPPGFARCDRYQVIIIIIIIIIRTMFMVLSSWHSHCESLPGSFDECTLSPGWPPTLRPNQPIWAASPPKDWLLPSTDTIAIFYYYYSARKLILILHKSLRLRRTQPGHPSVSRWLWPLHGNKRSVIRRKTICV